MGIAHLPPNKAANGGRCPPYLTLIAFEQKIYGAGIAFAPTTVLHAQIAAHARHTFRINLGDCFAYALAVTENLSLLTLDSDFRAVDIPVILPPGE